MEVPSKEIEGGFYESNRAYKIEGITSPHSWTKNKLDELNQIPENDARINKPDKA